MREVEETLHLASIAAEGLHGAANVRLYFSYKKNIEEHEIAMRRDNPVALDVIKIFTTLAIYEYGGVKFRSLPSD
jgi:hypothetical protein